MLLASPNSSPRPLSLEMLFPPGHKFPLLSLNRAVKISLASNVEKLLGVLFPCNILPFRLSGNIRRFAGGCCCSVNLSRSFSLSGSCRNTSSSLSTLGVTWVAVLNRITYNTLSIGFEPRIMVLFDLGCVGLLLSPHSLHLGLISGVSLHSCIQVLLDAVAQVNQGCAREFLEE